MQDVVPSKSGTEAQNWWPCAGSKGRRVMQQTWLLDADCATRSPTTGRTRRSRAERLMGTAAYGGKGVRERTRVGAERPISAASFRQQSIPEMVLRKLPSLACLGIRCCRPAEGLDWASSSISARSGCRQGSCSLQTFLLSILLQFVCKRALQLLPSLFIGPACTCRLCCMFEGCVQHFCMCVPVKGRDREWFVSVFLKCVCVGVFFEGRLAFACSFCWHWLDEVSVHRLHFARACLACVLCVRMCVCVGVGV